LFFLRNVAKGLCRGRVGHADEHQRRHNEKTHHTEDSHLFLFGIQGASLQPTRVIL
jgi:hypothetical protein